ncbi:MAG: tRNA pseudouridine(13) synthase TruD [Chloroflexi bacterium]|nr:tRNA pseudouridine(13) synthase TruD [Chloroflexota bacterium]
MRIKTIPEDFVVEELVDLAGGGSQGPFSVYRVVKRQRTTMEVQQSLATALGVPLSAVQFPGLKDREAVATQYATVRANGPERLAGDEYSATLVGHRATPLAPADLRGNHFVMTVRDLTPSEADDWRRQAQNVAQSGLPNYFDLQRFGSYVPGEGFIGKRILQRDEEGALKLYLAGEAIGDPLPVRIYKQYAIQHWGDWGDLINQAPRPSNYRSVLAYLRDHPTDYRRAVNLITPRLLPLLLAAYQSYLWNLMTSRYLLPHLEKIRLPVQWMESLDRRLPMYVTLPEPLLSRLRQISLPLPEARTSFEDPAVAEALQAVLKEEDLQLSELKARVLKRAYLPRGRRTLLLIPRECRILSQGPDDKYAHRSKVQVSFILPPGSYATLVLKALGLPPGG